MMIDKMNGVFPLGETKGVQKTSNASNPIFPNDTVSISQEARDAEEIRFLKEVADETPDVRMDKVEAFKAKLNDPNYINDALLAKTADKFMEALGI